jgi:hypothetical protein
MTRKAARKELAAYVSGGHLRNAVNRYGAMPLSVEAIELLMHIVALYCAPRQNRREHAQ